MENEILKNQVVIMEGILYGFWDSMQGKYDMDKEYIDDLKERIKITKSKIKS
jgi:hypothetical protein